MAFATLTGKDSNIRAFWGRMFNPDDVKDAQKWAEDQLSKGDVHRAVFLDTAPSTEFMPLAKYLHDCGVEVIVVDHHGVSQEEAARSGHMQEVRDREEGIKKYCKKYIAKIRKEAPGCASLVSPGEYLPGSEGTLFFPDGDPDGLTTFLQATTPENILKRNWPRLVKDGAILDGPPSHLNSYELSPPGWELSLAWGQLPSMSGNPASRDSDCKKLILAVCGYIQETNPKERMNQRLFWMKYSQKADTSLAAVETVWAAYVKPRLEDDPSKRGIFEINHPELIRLVPAGHNKFHRGMLSARLRDLGYAALAEIKMLGSNEIPLKHTIRGFHGGDVEIGILDEGLVDLRLLIPEDVKNTTADGMKCFLAGLMSTSIPLWRERIKPALEEAIQEARSKNDSQK